MKNKQIILLYGLFICLVLTLVGVFSAKNFEQLLSSFVYLPLIFYFASQLLNKGLFKSKTNPDQKRRSPQKAVLVPTSVTTEEGFQIADNDKRLFLKLIGSAGFSLLFMAMFTKKAQPSFFGSVPGPGVVAVKNIAGEKIDPAEAHPTDGYEVAEIDDATSPAYYGFLKKTGAWYIMKEDSAGAYRYTKGTTSFSTNWTGRAGLTYDYFNSIFG